MNANVKRKAQWIRQFQGVIDDINGREFSSHDFVGRFCKLHENEWKNMLARYESKANQKVNAHLSRLLSLYAKDLNIQKQDECKPSKNIHAKKTRVHWWTKMLMCFMLMASSAQCSWGAVDWSDKLKEDITDWMWVFTEEPRREEIETPYYRANCLIYDSHPEYRLVDAEYLRPFVFNKNGELIQAIHFPGLKFKFDNSDKRTARYVLYSIGIQRAIIAALNEKAEISISKDEYSRFSSKPIGGRYNSYLGRWKIDVTKADEFDVMKANNFKEYRFIVIGDLGVPYDIIKQLTKYFSKLGFKIIHLNDYDNLKPEGKSQCLLATYIYGDCPHIYPRQYTNDPCLLLEFTNMEGVSVLRAIGREENPKKCLKEIFEQIKALHYEFMPNTNANQEGKTSRISFWSKDDIINFLQKNSTKNIEGEIIDVLKRKYNEEIATYLKGYRNEVFNSDVDKHSVLNLDTLINKYNLDKHIRIFRLIKDPNSLTCTVDSVFVDSVCQDLFWNDFIPYGLSGFMPEEERKNLLDSIKLRQLKTDFQNNLYEVKNKENKRTLTFIENYVNGGLLDPIRVVDARYHLGKYFRFPDLSSTLENICKTQEAKEETIDYLKRLTDNPEEAIDIRLTHLDDIKAAENYVVFLMEHYDIGANSERVDATTFLVTLKVKDRKEQYKVLFKYRQGKHPFDVKLELELLPQSND